MADGALFKPEKDFTKEADKIIPEAESIGKKDVQKACDDCLKLCCSPCSCSRACSRRVAQLHSACTRFDCHKPSPGYTARVGGSPNGQWMCRYTA